MKQIKRYALLLVILVLAFALSACQNTDSHEKEEKRLVLESLVNRGEYAQALEVLESLGEDERDGNLLAYCRAAAAGEQGDFDTAAAGFASLQGYRDSGNMAAYYAARQHEAAAAEAAEGTDPAAEYLSAAQAYSKLPEFRDSGERADACMQAAYDYAESLLSQKQFDAAKAAFTQLGNYRDSSSRALQAKADALYEAGDHLGAYEIYSGMDNKYQTHKADYQAAYDAAAALKKEGRYAEAAEAFTALGGYMDSRLQVQECAYGAAKALLDAGQYDEAEAAFTALGDYEDSLSLIPECRYRKAVALLEAGETEEAGKIFTALEGYKDSDSYLSENQYQRAVALAAEGKYQEAVGLFEALVDYKDSMSLAAKAKADELYEDGDLAGAWLKYRDMDEAYQTHRQDYEALYAAAQALRESGDPEAAAEQFDALGEYGDSAAQASQCRYEKAEALKGEGKYDEAEAAFIALDGYLDSAEKAKECVYLKADALAAEGKYDEAVQLLESIGDHEGGEKLANRMKADQLFAGGDLAGAWLLYRDMDEVEPARLETYEKIYSEAGSLREAGEYDRARKQYQALGTYRDSESLAAQCVLDKAEGYIRQNMYIEALNLYESLGDQEKINEGHYLYAMFLREKKQYRHAVRQFSLCPDYRDSAEQRIQTAAQAFEDGSLDEAFGILKDEPESDEVREKAYEIAAAAAERENYELAIAVYDWLGVYKDAKIEQAKMYSLWGEQLYRQGEYDRSIEAFSALGDSFNAAEKISMVRYAKAKSLMDAGSYADARECLLELDAYEDSAELLKECDYELAVSRVAAGGLREALTLLDEIRGDDYRDTAQLRTECRYGIGLEEEQAGGYREAAEMFEACGDYRDSAERLLNCSYLYAVRLREASDVGGAAEWFLKARKHPDTIGQMEELAAFCDTMQMTADADHIRQAVLWIRAENAMDSGNYTEAAECYSQVTDEAFPKDREREAWAGAGRAMMDDGRYAEARDAFGKAEQPEGATEAWNAEGEADMAEGRYAEAGKAFLEAGNTERYGDALFEEGRALAAAGEYAEAFARFSEILDRAEVQEVLRSDPAFTALRLNVGDTIVLGAYEQDGNGDNGAEPVEWLVLAMEDGKALLISRYALECRPYNNKSTHLTWEECSLRKWLNGTFLQTAFSEAEQAAILTTQVDNGKSQGNPAWKISGGKDTEDRIFLLSYQEAAEYFTDAETRMCAATDHAVGQGAHTSTGSLIDGRPGCWWWLRSPGHSSRDAARVGTDGNRSNDRVSSDDVCVRPVLWVDLNAGVI